MRLNEEIVGIASYITYNSIRLITEIITPLESTDTDYYINFIKFFQNKTESFSILACLDWLDDLFLLNLGATFEKVINPKKLYIHNQDLYKNPIKDKQKTLTKAGHVIYKL